MLKIFCPVRTIAYTNKVREFMNAYPDTGLDFRWGHNLIGLYQAKYNTEKLPTLTEMKRLLDETYPTNLKLALPIYNGGIDKPLPLQGSSVKYYKGYIKNDNENTIFVFMTDTEGGHNTKAGDKAWITFHAEPGNPSGIQGQAYAITMLNKNQKSLDRKKIIENIKEFYKYAAEHPEQEFKLAFRNTSNERTYNGYTGKEMAAVFKAAGKIPTNVIFNETWIEEGLITSRDYDIKENNNVRYIQSDKKGNITLYEFDGLSEEDKLESFFNFLTYELSEDLNDKQNEFLLVESLKDTDFKNLNNFKKKVNNVEFARKILLWYQASVNMKTVDNTPVSTQRRKEIHLSALEETLKTAELYNSLFGTVNTKLNFSPSKYVNPVTGRADELNRLMTPEKRKWRASLIAITFYDYIDTIVKEAVEEIEDRIKRFEEKQSNPDTWNANTVRDLAELRAELADIKENKNIIKIINKKGGIPYIQEMLIDDFNYYIDQSVEDCIEEELDTNPYVYKTLKNKYPNDFLRVVTEYVNYKKEAYLDMVNYFDILFFEAFHEIHELTGIKLSATLVREEVTKTDEDGNIDNEIDEETGSTYKEEYLVKARETNYEKTLTKKIRALLAGIPAVDNAGKAKLDDLGETINLSSGHIYYMLLMETCTLNSVDEFGTPENPVKFLEKLKPKYKWVKMIIRRLKNEDGSWDTKTISELYSCLRLPFIPYYYYRSNGGGFIQPMNRYDGMSGALDSIRVRINGGKPLNGTAIYDEEGKTNKDNLEKVKEDWDDLKDRLQPGYIFDLLEEDDHKDLRKLCKQVVDIFHSIGVDTNVDAIYNILTNKESREFFLETVFSHIDNILDKAKKNIGNDANLFDKSKFNYTQLTKCFGLVDPSGIKPMAYNAGKMKYSFSAPNYIDKIVRGLSKEAFDKRLNKGDTGFTNRFNKLLQEEFMYDEFFYDAEHKKFRNKWLEWLDGNNMKMRDKFSYIQLDSIDGIPYNEWDSSMILQAIWSCWENKNENNPYGDLEKRKEKGHVDEYAYYQVPILSDSPAMLFVRAPKINSNDYILDYLVDVVRQEMLRIKRVRRRGELIKNGDPSIQPIQSYDQRFDENGELIDNGGAEFKFFPQLNNGSYYETWNRLLLEKGEREANRAIIQTLERVMQESFIESGLPKKYENFFYNSVFATSQIIQLMTTDLAYYPNIIDFQKRFKEIYAAGTRFNTNSKYGKKFRRSVTLKDMRLPSFSFQTIDDAISRNLKLSGIEKDFVKSNLKRVRNFKNINTTDAQTLLSYKEFRAMLDMMGAWDDTMEKALNHFIEGQWDMNDFMVVWQTLKPFMFTNRQLNTGLDTEDSEKMRVPLQYKNSEAMITSFMGLVKGEYSTSPILNGMNDFMEKYDIGSFIFESAVKVGGHSKIDLTHNDLYFQGYLRAHDNTVKIGNKEIKVKDYEDFMKQSVKLLESRDITQEEFHDVWKQFQFKSKEEVVRYLEKMLDADPDRGTVNEEKIDTISYEDVMIAQASNEHLVNSEDATLGSQFANIILSNLPGDFSININGKEYSKKEVKDLYHAIRVENILDCFDEVLHIFGSIENLQAQLRKAINNQQGTSDAELMKAIEIVEVVDPKTGENKRVFNIPPHTPMVERKLNQMILSIFKNKVTKQYISGGNATMISNFGLSDSLHIQKDENGNPIGIECYLPAYTKDMFEVLMDENGVLDISKLDPELLKVVGYRIPTEAKYSMLPLIVKGFLPQQMGSTIMMASEVIEMTGADFDIDKIYLIVPNIKVKEEPDFNALKNDMRNLTNFDAWNNGTGELNSNRISISEPHPTGGRWKVFVDMIKAKNASEVFKAGTFEAHMYQLYINNKEKYTKKKIVKVKYDPNKAPQEQSKEARDNMILDISFKTLTHPSMVPLVYTRGNFDTVKKAAAMARIYQNRDLLLKLAGHTEDSIKKLNNKQINKILSDIVKYLNETDTDTLMEFVNENSKTPFPLSPMQFINSHQAYTTGGKMIKYNSVIASHLYKTQETGMILSTNYVKSLNPVADSNITEIYNSKGQRRTDNIAQLNAATVDDSKEDNLRWIGQNPENASITSLLLAQGLDIIDISIILNNYSFMSEGPYKFKRNLKELDYIQFDNRTLLADNIHRTLFGKSMYEMEEDASLTFAYLRNLKMKLRKQARTYIRQAQVYRTDSPVASSYTMGELVLQNVRARLLDKQLSSENPTIIGGNILSVGIDPIIYNNKNEMRKKLLCSKVPMIEAFFACSIESPLHLLGNYSLFCDTSLIETIYTICEKSYTGSISKEIVNKILVHAVLYKLSKTSMFGEEKSNTAEEKRNYYIYQFPKVLRRNIKNDKVLSKNAFLNMLHITDKKISITGPSKLHDTTVYDLKRSASSLFETEEGRETAFGLLMYCYYKEGFRFINDGIGSYILNSDFIANFPILVDSLRTMNLEGFTEEEIDEFENLIYKNIPLNKFGMLVKEKDVNPINEKTSDGKTIFKVNANVENDFGRAVQFVYYEPCYYGRVLRPTIYLKCIDEDEKLYVRTKSASERTIPNYVTSINNVEDESDGYDKFRMSGNNEKHSLSIRHKL